VVGAVRLVLALALAAVAVLATGAVRLPVTKAIDPASIVHEDGLAFSAPGVSTPARGARAWPEGASDDSTLELLEDGRPLGPSHTYQEYVARLGQGRFLHRANEVLFSSSDGSDPRTNGRAYSLRYEAFLPWPLLGLLVIATLLANARGAARLLESIEGVHPAKIAAALFALALAYRIRIALGNPELTFGGHLVKGVPFSDADQWFTTARAFSRSDWSSNIWSLCAARRPFHYGLLGAIFALTGPSVFVARLLNVLASSATTVAIFDGTRRLAGRPVALAAALSQAIFLYDARSDLSVMTEPLGNFLGVLSLWAFILGGDLSSRKNGSAWLAFLGSGAALGLSNLARPLSLGTAATLPLALALILRRASVPWRSLVVGTLCLGAGVAVTVLPWLIHQKLAFGIWTISENTAEAWYGATSPTHDGTWSTEVARLAGPRPIRERVAFYMEGASRNLHEHLGWYVRHVLGQLVVYLRMTQASAWILALACASHVARAFAAPERSKRRSASVALGLLAIFAAFVPGAPLYPLTLVALVVALAARRPAALLAAYFVTIALSTSMIGLSFDRRLTHATEWVAAALVAWLGLETLRLLETGKLLERPLGDTGTWGKASRVVGFAGGLAFSVPLVGLGCALAARPPSHEVFLPSEPWVSRALPPDQRADLAAIESRLVVRKARVQSGFVMRFQANERIFQGCEIFEPRPYDFTIFVTDPELPETHAVLPGRLPPEALSRELVLVGFEAPHDEPGTVLELVALLSTEGEVIFRPDAATLGAHVRRALR